MNEFVWRSKSDGTRIESSLCRSILLTARHYVWRSLPFTRVSERDRDGKDGAYAQRGECGLQGVVL